MSEHLEGALELRDKYTPASGGYSWGESYGKDLLVDLNQLAHARGTEAVTRDALQRAYAEITRLRKQLPNYKG